jgi:hypothetical protein
MNTAENKNELGHRNFNRSGFCLIYSLHILPFSFHFFCSVPQNFVLWYEKVQWPETPVFTRLSISVYRRFKFVHIGNLNENNSVGRSYKWGIKGLVPIVLPTAYTCSGVLLEKYPFLFLSQSCAATEGTIFRVLIKVVYQYFNFSHFSNCRNEL